MWNAFLFPSPSVQFLLILQVQNVTLMRSYIILLKSTLLSSFSQLCCFFMHDVTGNQPLHVNSCSKWHALPQINSAFLSWESLWCWLTIWDSFICSFTNWLLILQSLIQELLVSQDSTRQDWVNPLYHLIALKTLSTSKAIEGSFWHWQPCVWIPAHSLSILIISIN